MKPADLTGQKFGLLTALYRNGKNKEGRYMWRCKCECGNEYDVAASSLTSGNTRSCGCLQPKRAREAHLKHGDLLFGKKATKLYEVWRGMKSRCTYKRHVEHKNYGQRGISVCAEWASDYVTFRDWALKNGYKEGLQLDRIDNDKGYSPENCRFVTRLENAQNRSDTIRAMFRGEKRTITEIAGITGLSRQLIYHRIRNNCSEENLSKPSRKQKQTTPHGKFLTGVSL